MEKSNNKKRILALVEILRKESDETRHLRLDEIVMKLEEKGITINNRKTLYDDFKVLNEFGINIEYDNGYYLLDAPFNLSEIKIIIDSLNSLKSLDDRFLEDISNKLYSFISEKDAKLISNLSYKTKHANIRLLQHMEAIIDAIRYNRSIEIKTANSSEYKEIFPKYLYRYNDYYYIYCHYPESDKIYHYRFDSIKDIKVTDRTDVMTIPTSKVISNIKESVNAFNKGNARTVTLELLECNEKLVSYIMDDFPDAMRTKRGFSLKSDINNIFFSKLTKYGNSIMIKEKDIALEFRQYLDSIIKVYQG